MTSANEILYRIELNGEQIGSHRENVMCKFHFEKLVHFLSLNDCTITSHGYDEDEEYWEGESKLLIEFLKEKARTEKVLREELDKIGIEVESISEWFKRIKREKKLNRIVNSEE